MKNRNRGNLIVAEFILENGLEIRSIDDEVLLSPIRMWDKLVLMDAARTPLVQQSDECGNPIRTVHGMPLLRSNWVVEGITGYQADINEDGQDRLRVQTADDAHADLFVKWAVDTLHAVYVQRKVSEQRINPVRRRPEPTPKPKN